jgi:hypothetical protein
MISLPDATEALVSASVEVEAVQGLLQDRGDSELDAAMEKLSQHLSEARLHLLHPRSASESRIITLSSNATSEAEMAYQWKERDRQERARLESMRTQHSASGQSDDPANGHKGASKGDQLFQRSLACHAVSGRSGSPGQRPGTQPNGLPGVTVADRHIPLVTAAYGT